MLSSGEESEAEKTPLHDHEPQQTVNEIAVHSSEQAPEASQPEHEYEPQHVCPLTGLIEARINDTRLFGPSEFNILDVYDSLKDAKAIPKVHARTLRCKQPRQMESQSGSVSAHDLDAVQDFWRHDAA